MGYDKNPVNGNSGKLNRPFYRPGLPGFESVSSSLDGHLSSLKWLVPLGWFVVVVLFVAGGALADERRRVEEPGAQLRPPPASRRRPDLPGQTRRRPRRPNAALGPAQVPAQRRGPDGRPGRPAGHERKNAFADLGTLERATELFSPAAAVRTRPSSCCSTSAATSCSAKCTRRRTSGTRP